MTHFSSESTFAIQYIWPPASVSVMGSLQARALVATCSPRIQRLEIHRHCHIRGCLFCGHGKHSTDRPQRRPITASFSFVNCVSRFVRSSIGGC